MSFYMVFIEMKTNLKNSRKEQLNSSIVSSVKLLASRVSFLFWSIMSRESEKITPPELPLPKK